MKFTTLLNLWTNILNSRKYIVLFKKINRVGGEPKGNSLTNIYIG